MLESEKVSYTLVPYLCSGMVLDKMKDTNGLFEVEIYKSPIGAFQGPIYCQAIYSANGENKYKPGVTVKILLTFVYDHSQDAVIDVAPSADGIILGQFDEESLINSKIENPLLPDAVDAIRLYNSKSNAGISVDGYGSITIATAGPLYSAYRRGGFSINKDSSIGVAQNHHRVIANANPFSTAKEHFGLYTGKDDNDELARSAPLLNPIVYRRYTPQSQDLLNWVSTCEGTYAPYFGPNNSDIDISSNKDILFYKAVNNKVSRMTFEAGAPGDTFINLRLDRIISSEKSMPISPGAITSVVGNLFKFSVDNTKGDFSLSAGSAGIPGANINGVKFTTKDGVLTIQAAKGIVLTSGDGEEDLHSVRLSSDGIELNDPGSVTVNGSPVVHQSYLDWFIQNMPNMFIAPMGPCVPNPAALTTLLTQSKLPSLGGGMVTTGVPVPLPGIIFEEDPYTSI